MTFWGKTEIDLQSTEIDLQPAEIDREWTEMVGFEGINHNYELEAICVVGLNTNISIVDLKTVSLTTSP